MYCESSGVRPKLSRWTLDLAGPFQSLGIIWDPVILSLSKDAGSSSQWFGKLTMKELRKEIVVTLKGPVGLGPRSENRRDDGVRKINCRSLSGGTDGNQIELFDGAGEIV